MKRFLIIALLFAFSLPAFSQNETGKYAGTYEFHFPGTTLSHYIILTQAGDKLTGKYLGCEAGNDTIYYSASMKNLEIGADGKITFKLKGFRLSPTPLVPGKEELSAEGQANIKEKIQQSGKTGTAMFITGGYTFFGTIGKKKIDLQRVADWYDNAADQMKFTRSSD